ncbi:alpha/beta fold hydrolase [uncultured Chryseobacterium sp.]|uniref:alpha/beta hydrolase family protein n=1 Tax=uncultured Chryseobacterium sp. TaxID=259322 RepID=UPI0025DC39AE|nr:alpha/beta fold hydrolase [uncultured Chryseobacterium sp.]
MKFPLIMANPKPIKDVTETSTLIPAANLLIERISDGKAFKISTDVLSKTIVSGIKGDATPSSSPTPWASGNPDLYEKWDVKTAGTYTNFLISPGNPVVVITDDLKNNFVQIWVKNGVSQKVLSPKPDFLIKADDILIDGGEFEKKNPNMDLSTINTPAGNRIWFNLDFAPTTKDYLGFKISIYVKNNLDAIKLYKQKSGVITLVQSVTPTQINAWNDFYISLNLMAGTLIGVLSDGTTENIQFGDGPGMVGFDRNTLAQDAYLTTNDIKYSLAFYAENPKSLPEVLAELRPYEQGQGVIFFKSKVNVKSFNSSSQTIEINFPYEESEDSCAIRLPDNYNSNGKPHPLIIYCHGAGGQVTGSVTNLNDIFSKYWASKGFATLDVNALPDSLKKSWMNPAQCAGFGSEYSINSVINAYNIAMRRWNLDSKNVFVVGTSMGGLTAGNLVATNTIPIKAVWLDAPVTGLFESAWVHQWWGDASGVQINMAISYLYGFDNWNESAKTFTVLSGTYSGTYSFETILTTEPNGQAKLNAFYEQNKSKTIGRNPFQNKRVKTLNDEALIYPCPIVISHGSGDTVNSINTNKDYLNLIKNGGQITYFREVSTNNHGTFGDGNGPELAAIGWPGLGSVVVEIYRFFKKYM